MYIYIYTHTHIVHNMATVVGRREFKKLGTAVNAACQGNLTACHRLAIPLQA